MSARLEVVERRRGHAARRHKLNLFVVKIQHAGAVLVDQRPVADGLLVPLVPGPLSVRALDQLADLAERVADRRSEERAPLTMLPFFSMVDRRKRLHRETIEAIQLGRPETLSVQIPMSAEIERMPVYRVPTVSRTPDAPAALAFVELWREAQLRMAWAANVSK